MSPENEEPLLPGDIEIPYERKPGALWSWDRIGYFRNALMKFGRMMDADFYAKPPMAFEAATYHYLNSASLPNPVGAVRAEARRVFELWQRGQLTGERKKEILADARREAAALVNLGDERGVVLCRNASEAISFFLWLSGIMHKKGEMPLVLSTDAENPSIQREIFIIKDHSNTDRKDPITTYPEFASQRPQQYTPPSPRATGLRWGHFSVARSSEEESLDHLKNFIQHEAPGVLILSHVLRSTGRELPVSEWTRKAREWKRQFWPHDPELFVCIDGAQALGNITIDFASLDCDMYVGSGQKALQGETVGLLYIDPSNPRVQAGLERVRGLRPDTQVVLRGMFHEDLDVAENVDDDVSYPEIAGFTANMKRLKAVGLVQGNDVSALAKHRAALRQTCIEGLQRISGEAARNIEILDMDAGTPFILSFRVGPDPFVEHGGWSNGLGNPEGIFEPGAMHSDLLPTESWGRSVAQELRKRGVGIAFLRRGNTFRLSFSDQTTEENVAAFLQEFADVALGMRPSKDA